MIWPPDPKSWSEFPAECFWYLLPGIAFHILAVVLSSIGIRAIRSVSRYRPKFSTAMIFQGYLLIAAMIANGIWSCVIWGRFYWSIDYTADFSVFMPFVRNQVTGGWSATYYNSLNGVSLTELNMFWLIFALGAWTAAFFATRWKIRRNRMGGPTAEDAPHPQLGQYALHSQKGSQLHQSDQPASVRS